LIKKHETLNVGVVVSKVKSIVIEAGDLWLAMMVN